jgi:hypothetical protein
MPKRSRARNNSSVLVSKIASAHIPLKRDNIPSCRLAMRQNVWCRTGCGRRALGLEFAPQLEEIVDFTVEHDHMPTIAGNHRLIAPFAGVDDCQPTVAECQTTVRAEPMALAKGTAMRDQVCQSRDFRRFDRVAAEVHDTCNSAHFSDRLERQVQVGSLINDARVVPTQLQERPPQPLRHHLPDEEDDPAASR